MLRRELDWLCMFDLAVKRREHSRVKDDILSVTAD